MRASGRNTPTPPHPTSSDSKSPPTARPVHFRSSSGPAESSLLLLLLLLFGTFFHSDLAAFQVTWQKRVAFGNVTSNVPCQEPSERGVRPISMSEAAEDNSSMESRKQIAFILNAAPPPPSDNRLSSAPPNRRHLPRPPPCCCTAL